VINAVTPADAVNASGQKRYFAVLLLVLLLGGWLRFTHLDWDGLQHTHPDERYINWVETTIEWSGGPRIWLHPERSSLNPFFWPETKTTTGIELPRGEPRRFAYGHFPLYLTVLAVKGLAAAATVMPGIGGSTGLGDLLNVAGRIEYEHLTLVGRALAAAADTITILLVYLLGRRLGGVTAGLLAAALAGLAVQHIQQAHFGTFDALLTACVTASLWSLARYVAKGNARNIILSGVLIGLAVGSKFSAVMLVLPAATAVFWSSMGRPRGRASARQGFVHGLLLLCATLLTFALTNPFALLQWRAFFEDIARQGAMVRGLVDWPFVAQYRETVPYAYQIAQQGRWLLGWPLTLAVYGGAVWCLWEWMRRLRGRDRGVQMGQFAVLFAWSLPYFIVTGAFVVKFPRYMLLVLPVMFVFAGLGLAAVLRRRPLAGRALVALVLLPTGAYALAFVELYDAPHPWVSASDSIYANAPSKARILLEKWDHPLPLDRATDGGRLSRKRYNLQLFDPVARPDDERKLTELLAAVSTSDFIVIASNRNYGPVGLLVDAYPLTRAYYRALFDGALGYELVAAATRFPELGGIAMRSDPFSQADMPWPRDLEPISPSDLRPGFADESFTVYDHPLVLVYRNYAGLSASELRSRLLQQ
jgi:4-amino-4-deoxy-L-arabinose transferase-like glycosyltransferase|tara:strand:- start:321 stop:2258 length:1938 start_codon:yes stop_codon:yes gene_type:complete